jgi:hypothetical protein
VPFKSVTAPDAFGGGEGEVWVTGEKATPPASEIKMKRIKEKERKQKKKKKGEIEGKEKWYVGNRYRLLAVLRGSSLQARVGSTEALWLCAARALLE